MTAAHSLRVELGPRSYPVKIGQGLLDDGPMLRESLTSRRVIVVSNTVVAPLYLHRLTSTLGDIRHAALILPDGEAYKTLSSVERIFAALGEFKATRDACLVALGGGVIGDMTGFAAACWMRGIDFVQVPTSLLAMVDASVGGKTGVNLSIGKNLVGAFHQPRAVLIDTNTLTTLPEREYHAGLAEVVKHSAIGDVEFFARLEAGIKPLRTRDPETLAEVIAHSCRFKAAIVARDETERGERALLNFGHTFAHALETETGYTSLLHGEAVAIGMCLAARLSAALGMAPAAAGERLAAVLNSLGLATGIPPGLEPERLLTHMRLDKKNCGDALRLILWRGIGRAEMIEDTPIDAILAVLRQNR